MPQYALYVAMAAALLVVGALKSSNGEVGGTSALPFCANNRAEAAMLRSSSSFICAPPLIFAKTSAFVFVGAHAGAIAATGAGIGAAEAGAAAGAGTFAAGAAPAAAGGGLAEPAIF